MTDITIADSRPGDVKPSLYKLLDFFSCIYCWCAGIARDQWSKIDGWTKTKRSTIGALLVAGVSVSSLAMGFALCDASKITLWAMVPICVTWFFLIFCLDRGLLMSLDGAHSKLKVITTLFARFCLAAVVGVVSGTTIVELVFHSEITGYLQRERASEIRAIEDGREQADAPLIADIGKLRSSKVQRTSAAESEYNTWYTGAWKFIVDQRNLVQKIDDELTAEVTGQNRAGRTTGVAGDGPAAKRKLAEFENLKRALAQAETEFNRENERRIGERERKLNLIHIDLADELTKLESDRSGMLLMYKNRLADLKATPVDGIGNRYRALKHLMGENFLVLAMYILVLVLEMAPYLVKVGFRKDQYDSIIDALAEKTEADYQAARAKIAVARAESMSALKDALIAELASKTAITVAVGDHLESAGLAMKKGGESNILQPWDEFTMNWRLARDAKRMQRSINQAANAA